MATSVWKGHLSFGLVSIPVRLFKAARAEKISFRQLRKVEPQPIHEVKRVDQDPEPEPESEPETYAPVHQVPRTDVVKGFEYEKDHFAVIKNEELKQIEAKTGTEMQILEFVQLAEIDPIYFETSYYMAPDDAGQKAYALLFQTMRDAGSVALAEVAMHRREHVVVVRPGEHGLIAHTMFYANEIRADQEYRADTSQVNAKELQLAKQLVGSLAAPFEPAKYKDKYREKLQAMIDARVQGREIAEEPPARKAAEVVDIMDALRNSLKMAKKPVASVPSKRKRASGS